MENRFIRCEKLIGDKALAKLKNSRVAVFGVGGVGGYVAEALARTGVGTIDLIDSDTVDITNLNRQIIALESTIGRNKTEVMSDRIKDVNPEARINCHNLFFSADTVDVFDFSKYDYIADAIDTVSSKLLLIKTANTAGVPIISSMGTGNKLNPAALEVTDIYKTSVCPLARVMRYELKKLGIKNLKVVYSKEEPKNVSGERVPASCVFVPATAGMIIASEIVKEIISK